MLSPTWTPPDDPNPSEILNSTVDDTRTGAYETALAKFLWFHKNAVRLEPGQSAVRVSFALGYWLELANVFPPARDAYIQTRDETESALRADWSNFDLFRDVAYLNRHLGDEIRTADLFAYVATRDHATAQRLYHVAERDLIAVGRYRDCGPFLDSPRRIELAAECYRMSRQFEESSPQRKVPIPKLARKQYMQNVATLVALLALNDRKVEAHQTREDAYRVLDDDDFRAIMDAAMTGHLPDRRLR